MRDGQIVLGSGFKLDRSVSEVDLLTAMPNDAKPLVHNGAYRSYLLPKTALNGREFRPSVYFANGKITSVHLTWADPEAEGGSAWENFSFERERSIAETDRG